jgi:exopolyphosphatase/guanosine-5'-triphosphate,3'-diphosphate pyrophosphatase
VRVATIDIGTNSFHLLVADVLPDGAIHTIETARSQVMLGSGGLEKHRLSDEAIERGLVALRSFKSAAETLAAEEIYATATSAVREAANGAEFCAVVKAETGIHVRVISGLDEARLIWLGVRPALDFSRGPVLAFDVGGGSTEFIVGDSDQTALITSLHLGHIRLTDRFRRSDPISADDHAAMRKHVRAELAPLSKRLKAMSLGGVVGTSGTARCLARMAVAARTGMVPDHEEGLVLTRKEVDRLLERLTETPSDELVRLPGMDMRRKDTLLAGAVLVREVLRAAGADQLTTSERSLREGLVVDWVMHHRPEIDLSRDHMPRERSVLLAMQRFGVDRPHAEQVTRLALAIFDGTARLHKLAASDRELLRDAALLHDIGHHISGQGHHRHGQYLLKHIRMYGFSSTEVALLGNLVRYHTGGRPRRKNEDFAALSRDEQRRVRVMAGILQVADALDRSHNQPIRSLDVSTHSGQLRLRAIAEDGGDVERWAADQRRALLEETLGLKLQIEVEGA